MLKPPPLSEQDRQRFGLLQLAGRNGDLALLSALDAKTGEPRAVVCIADRSRQGGVVMIPLGHLTAAEDPFSAYKPDGFDVPVVDLVGDPVPAGLSEA